MKSTIIKTVGTFVLMATLGQFVASAQCVSPPSKALNWWPADGNTSDVVRGSDGFLRGGAAYAEGKVGQAFDLPQGGYVNVPHDDVWGWGTRDFTIELWVNFRSYQPGGIFQVPEVVFVGVDDGAYSQKKWLFGMHTNSLTFHINSDCMGEGKWLGNIPFVPNFDEWYHLAIVRSGSVFTIYTNGIAAGSESFDFSIPNPVGDLNIGWAPDENAQKFNGLLDEVTIYGRALCATEIAAVHSAGTAGKCPPACAMPPSDLAAWWPAEANASDIVYGQGGTIRGGVSYSCNGYVGQAFNLDGRSGYVEVANNSHINFTGPFTAEAWVNYTGMGSGAGLCVVAKGVDAESPIDWALNISSNRKLRPHVKVNGSWVNFDCNTTLNAGTWYHVAMVYDGSSLKGYVNGQPDGSTPASGTVAASANSLRIGAYAPVYGSTSKCFFAGSIDEVSLYRRALSAAEIQTLFSVGSAGKCVPPPTSSPAAQPSGIVACWPADCIVNPWNYAVSYYHDIIGWRASQPSSGTTIKAGFVGNAFGFSGQDYVSVDDDPDLNPSEAITVECWLKREAVVGSYDPVIKKAGIGSGQNGGYTLEFLGNNIRFGVFNGAWRLSSSAPIQLGQWYHVAGVYDGTRLSLYVNGNLIGAPVSTSGNIVASSNPLRMGNDPANLTRFFNGRVDEVTIYNRALTGGEVQAVYGSGRWGKRTFSIITQPVSQRVEVGSYVTFSVVASGRFALTYQWYHDGVFVGSGDSLNLSNVQLSDRGEYHVVVSDGTTSICSDSAFLSVGQLAITKQPASQCVLLGRDAKFSVEAVGNGVLRYAWKHKGSVVGTEASLMLPNVQFSDAGEYRVTVSDMNDTVESLPATLTVVNVSDITSLELSLGADIVPPGTSVPFAAKATTIGGQVLVIENPNVSISPLGTAYGALPVVNGGTIVFPRLPKEILTYMSGDVEGRYGFTNPNDPNYGKQCGGSYTVTIGLPGSALTAQAPVIALPSGTVEFTAATKANTDQLGRKLTALHSAADLKNKTAFQTLRTELIDLGQQPYFDAAQMRFNRVDMPVDALPVTADQMRDAGMVGNGDDAQLAVLLASMASQLEQVTERIRQVDPQNLTQNDADEISTLVSSYGVLSQQFAALHPSALGVKEASGELNTLMAVQISASLGVLQTKSVAMADAAIAQSLSLADWWRALTQIFSAGSNLNGYLRGNQIQAGIILANNLANIMLANLINSLAPVGLDDFSIYASSGFDARVCPLYPDTRICAYDGVSITPGNNCIMLVGCVDPAVLTSLINLISAQSATPAVNWGTRLKYWIDIIKVGKGTASWLNAAMNVPPYWLSTGTIAVGLPERVEESMFWPLYEVDLISPLGWPDVAQGSYECVGTVIVFNMDDMLFHAVNIQFLPNCNN